METFSHILDDVVVVQVKLTEDEARDLEFFGLDRFPVYSRLNSTPVRILDLAKPGGAIIRTTIGEPISVIVKAVIDMCAEVDAKRQRFRRAYLYANSFAA